MSGRIPEIPLDIVHIILQRLDQLDDRREILANCSEVCRQWYAEAHKLLASRSIVLAIDKITIGWTKWLGKPMQVPLDPAFLTHLLVYEGEYFDHRWLTAAITSFPCLRHLSIQIFSLLSFRSGLSGSLPPFSHRLESLELEGNLPKPGDNIFTLLRCFPGVKAVSFKEVTARIPMDYHVDCDITPSSVSITGRVDHHFYFWFKLLNQPRTANSIRHLSLAFEHFMAVYDEGCVQVLENLKNLNTLEVDFYALFTEARGDNIPNESRIIEREFAAALTPTLHTLRIRLPVESSPRFPACVSLLKAMPSTLRRVEIYTGFGRDSINRYFNFAKFVPCFARFHDLDTVEVVIDDALTEDVDAIADYRDFLENGFKELAARGALRLTSELRPPEIS